MILVSPRNPVAAEKAFADERAKGKTAGVLFGGGAGDGQGAATEGAGEQRLGDDGGREGIREPGAGGDQAALAAAARGGEAETAGVSVAITWLLTGRSRRFLPQSQSTIFSRGSR
jgi:hypothetical protein